MPKERRALVLVALVGACATRPAVREADVTAWSGAATRDLQLHPFFSTLPRRVEDLGGGEQLWTFSNCFASKVECRSKPGQGSPTAGVATTCTQAQDVCCHNQFLVRGDTVEGYRLAGNCFTDCSVRPPSRPCSSEEEGQDRRGRIWRAIPQAFGAQ